MTAATCAVEPSDPLRADCRLRLSSPAPAEVEITDGEEVAVFSTSESFSTHELPIWGLHPESAWTFVARAGGAEVTGEFVTGALPRAVQVEVQQSGEGPASLVHVLVPLDCDRAGHVTILDRAGRVRWYADTGGEDVDMVQFTDASTVLAIADQRSIVEFDLGGRELLRKEDFELPVHHDVMRREDRIYTLLADARPATDGKTYVEDMVVAFDPGGAEVWRWDERDWLDPTLAGGEPSRWWGGRFPGAIDAWHTNGLYVTDDRDVVVSLHREEAVLRISGSDGSIDWVVAGDGVGNVLASTLALLGGEDATFGRQHHPALLPDGHLTLFDNPRDRAAEYSLDEAAGTATFVADWETGLRCPVQSSVFPMAGGGRIVTCADGNTLVEFDAAGRETRRLVLRCSNGTKPPRTIRGQPLDLWSGTQVGAVTATRIAGP